MSNFELKMNIEKEKRVILATAVRNLQDVGFWPKKDGDKMPLIFSSWFFIIGLLLNVGLAGHMYKASESGKRSDLVNDLFILLIYSFEVVTVSLLYFRGEAALKLYGKLNKCQIPKETEQYLEKLARAFYLYSTIVNCLCIVTAYFLDKECFQNRKEGNGDGYICGVFYPAWFPIDLDYTPWKQIIHLMNIMEIVYATPKLASSLVFFYGSIKITEERIKTLKSKLKNIRITENNSEEVLKELKSVAGDYSDINSIVNDMESTIGFIFSPCQHILLGLIIAFSEFQVVVEKKRNVAPTVFFWLIFEGLCCWKGQCLEDASVALAEQVYEFPWYDLDPSARSIFKIFHGQVRVKLQLKCPPVITINFAHFYEVMKRSYSLLMYLKKMY